MLVRRLVSGVRNSWPASEMSCACCWREDARARSMELNDRASRASSSSPSVVDRRLKILGSGDVLGRRREPLDGADGRPSHQVAEAHSDGDPGQSDDPQDEAQIRQGALDISQGAGDLDGERGPGERAASLPP